MADESRPFDEDELLAYLRGSAPADLLQRIEAEMERNSSFQAEVALMRGLKSALAEPDDLNLPSEFGWRRLEAEINREVQDEKPQVRRQSAIWRIAAVVFGLAVLGQGVYIASSLNQAGPAYRTATQIDAEHVLSVAFFPTASAAEISALLRDANGRIVDGPSAIGLYRIAFESTAELQAGLAALEQSGLTELVAEE